MFFGSNMLLVVVGGLLAGWCTMFFYWIQIWVEIIEVLTDVIICMLIRDGSRLFTYPC